MLCYRWLPEQHAGSFSKAGAATAALAPTHNDAGGYLADPSSLDNALQLGACVQHAPPQGTLDKPPGSFVPVGLACYRFSAAQDILKPSHTSASDPHALEGVVSPSGSTMRDHEMVGGSTTGPSGSVAIRKLQAKLLQGRPAALSGATTQTHSQQILYELGWLASVPASSIVGGISGDSSRLHPPSGYPLKLVGSNPLAAGLAALQTIIKSSPPSLQLTTPGGVVDAPCGLEPPIRPCRPTSSTAMLPMIAPNACASMRRAHAAGLWAMLRSAGTEMPSMQIGGTMQGSHVPIQDRSLLQQQFIRLQVGTHLVLPGGQPNRHNDGGFGVQIAAGLQRQPRLLPRAVQPMQGPFRLEPHLRGALTNLALVPHPTLARPQGIPTSIPHGCVVLEVKAVGVNFRDVLNVLGMYPGDPGMPGSDCAGIVTQIGPGVDSLRVGDSVVGLAEGSLGSHVVASAETVVKMPGHVTHAEAASLPTVCITADAALRQVGQALQIMMHP